LITSRRVVRTWVWNHHLRFSRMARVTRPGDMGSSVMRTPTAR
jgi:hypothetical protein